MKKDKSEKITKKKLKKQSKYFRTFGLKKQIYFLIENLSALLSAGMDIASSVSALKEEAKSKRIRTILDEVAEDIEGGSTLSDALQKAGILSPHMFSLISLGEESGRLVDNLKVIVLQNEKETVFRSKVRSSLMYAVIVFTLTIVVGLGTAWFTLPKLSSFLGELEVELPLITRILISIGSFLEVYGFIFIPLFLLFVVSAFYFLFSFPKTKFIGHRILFRLPLIKRLIKQVEIARFGFLFGTMLEAGMPIIDAVKSIQGTTTFLNYTKFYGHMKDRIEEGNSIQQCFVSFDKSKNLFPPSVRQMLAAAEKSGSLAETLLKIGRMYEQKTEATARNLPIILEPILLLFVGIGVALLALGILMPIYSLANII